jgi:osmotically-inducible protein OsmY
MNDKLLRQQVIDQLDWDPSINSAHIGVAVDQGVVTLTGHVATYLEKIAAEKVARGVKGVRAIVQEMKVQLAGDHPIDDEEIARQALTAIGFNSMIPAEAIQVKVAQGWVTLSGQVDWQYQRTAVELDVRKLRGVVGMTNAITLRPRPYTTDLERRIREALERDAALDAKAIRIKIEGERVTLDGTVDCWRDRDLVERAVWAAPGVRAVEDHLRIG